MEAGTKHNGVSTVDKVRPWIIMAIGVILTLYSLTEHAAPAALMLGCSMIGGVPLDLAFSGTKTPAPAK